MRRGFLGVTCPTSVAPNIDASRVQRVADAMFQAGMLSAPFPVSSMLRS